MTPPAVIPAGQPGADGKVPRSPTPNRPTAAVT